MVIGTQYFIISCEDGHFEITNLLQLEVCLNFDFFNVQTWVLRVKINELLRLLLVIEALLSIKDIILLLMFCSRRNLKDHLDFFFNL